MILKDVENQLYYCTCLITSLEAKLERVEPISVEFEDLMNTLFSTRDRIRELAIQRTKLIHESVTADLCGKKEG